MSKWMTFSPCSALTIPTQGIFDMIGALLLYPHQTIPMPRTGCMLQDE